MCDAETIPDGDLVSREVDFPRTYTDAVGLIWDQIFVFPSKSPVECVVWRKYAPRDKDVHVHGCERERMVRQRKPEFRYTGFVSVMAGVIRDIQTAAGHSFDVVHTPAEGVSHAEIRFKPAADQEFSRGQRDELKISIRKIFGDYVQHSCPESI